MNIALIGYGKMGKTIEAIAISRGHKIVSIVDVDNQEEYESEAFASADVAIEFTFPQVAVENYRKAWKAGVKVVSGTTGWIADLPAIKKEIEDNGYTLFWTSNFSIGVNIFFALNSYLARIMNNFNQYDPSMLEVHHIHKLDAPSGTAITLAEGVIEELERKSAWALAPSDKPNVMPIEAERRGEVPGFHSVTYESEVDTITISHDAKSRHGFALGAVVAAEYTHNKSGFVTMQDLMKDKLK